MTSRELSIYADLQVVVDDDTQFAVTASGGQALRIELASLADGLHIWRKSGAMLSPILARFGAGLSIFDVTVAVLVDDVEVARLGGDAPNTIIGRLSGMPSLRLEYLTVLRLLFS